MNHSNQANAEISSSKTWTIRKVDEDTIRKTKAAAQKSGMKIGAWIDSELTRAAERSLEGCSDLTKEFSRISKNIEGNRMNVSPEKLYKLEQDVDQLFKGQHSILVEQRNMIGLLSEIKTLISRD